jgi:hypothetical protein
LLIFGTAIGWLNLYHFWDDPKKVHFSEVLMSQESEIPRETLGFENFLKAFPPPHDVNPNEVNAIADKELRINSSSDVASTVAYVAHGHRTPTVARFDQVKDWANSNFFDILSLISSSIGILLAIPLAFHDYRNDKVEQGAAANP